MWWGELAGGAHGLPLGLPKSLGKAAGFKGATLLDRVQMDAEQLRNMWLGAAVEAEKRAN